LYSTINREAIEEAGVEIDDIKIRGYVLIKQIVVSKKYPQTSILPITVSKVKRYIHNWQKLETKDRDKFTFKQALDKFNLREDNKQMYEIFEYIINKHGSCPVKLVS